MYLNYKNPYARFVKIFIDGIQERHCFEADEEAGMALCAVLTPEGKCIPAAFVELGPKQEAYQEVVAEWQRGYVEIRFDTPEHRAECEKYLQTEREAANVS